MVALLLDGTTATARDKSEQFVRVYPPTNLKVVYTGENGQHGPHDISGEYVYKGDVTADEGFPKTRWDHVENESFMHVSPTQSGDVVFFLHFSGTMYHVQVRNNVIESADAPKNFEFTETTDTVQYALRIPGRLFLREVSRARAAREALENVDPPVPEPVCDLIGRLTFDPDVWDAKVDYQEKPSTSVASPEPLTPERPNENVIWLEPAQAPPGATSAPAARDAGAASHGGETGGEGCPQCSAGNCKCRCSLM